MRKTLNTCKSHVTGHNHRFRRHFAHQLEVTVLVWKSRRFACNKHPQSAAKMEKKQFSDWMYLEVSQWLNENGLPQDICEAFEGIKRC